MIKHNVVIPKVAAIHDLSGFGRCALTVIIPVLSSMGLQVCPMPTAILSTHTGGFEGFSFVDLTDSMVPYAKHWKNLDMEFDCIYSGFLGSEKQIKIIADFIKEFKVDKKQLILVDPVMADEGELYSTYTDEMKSRMKELVEMADVITPNLTEACFLLNKPYDNKAMSIEIMKQYLKDLSNLGPDRVVITGIPFEDGGFANIGYSKKLDKFWKVPYKCLPVNYPGTGDIFASVLIGGLLKDEELSVAMDRATQFLSLVVGITYESKGIEREGVYLEKELSWLNKGEFNKTFREL